MRMAEQDMADYSCPTAVIAPLYIAVCVCDPEHPEQKDTCEWTTSVPAAVRLRLFVQESLLAMLLLMNYLEIVLEHMLRREKRMRQQGQSVACCCTWALRLIQAGIPFSIVSLALAIISFENDQAEVPIRSWRTGIIGDTLLHDERGSAIYLAQLQIYWVTGAVVMGLLGRAMWPTRPALSVVYAIISIGTLGTWLLNHAVYGPLTAGNGSGASIVWFFRDLALFLAGITIVAAARSKVARSKLCCASATGSVVLGCTYIFAVACVPDSTILADAISILQSYCTQLFGLLLLWSCNNLWCCEGSDPHSRRENEIPLMPLRPIAMVLATQFSTGTATL